MPQQFDLMGQSYEETLRAHPHFRQDELHFLFDRLRPGSGMKVLDFTAGSGFLTFPLAECVGPQGSVTAVDASAVMLGLLRSKLPAAAPVECVLTTDPTLPELAGKTFDRIVSLGGFHHVENQVEVCRTLYRLLAPGGLAAILDFADGTPAQVHFDGLVNDFNPFGHHALFLSPSRALNLARFAGCPATATDIRPLRFPWRFANLQQAGAFFVGLHGLRCSPEEAANRVRAAFPLSGSADAPLELAADYVQLSLRKPSSP